MDDRGIGARAPAVNRVDPSVDPVDPVVDRGAVEELAAAVEAGVGRLEPLTGDADAALRHCYRLFHTALARRAGALVTVEDSLSGPGAPQRPSRALQAAVAEVAGALGSALPERHREVPELLLGAVHERLLGRDPGARKGTGSWFTPPRLVAHLLDEALEPTLDEVGDPGAVTVLDPACGSGLFLVGAARRIASRLSGGPAAERLLRAVGQVHGTDLDAGAVELARVCLWLLLVEPGRPAPTPPLHLQVGDALRGDLPGRAYDVVVGNPPFLNRLERRSAVPPEVARSWARESGGVLGPYTDVSAVFLHRAAGWVRAGGRVGLVQPQSVLGARDAAGVRRSLAGRGALESFWASDRPVFDASALTCALVLRIGADQGGVRRAHGPDFAPVPARRVSAGELDTEWGFLLAAGLGVPEVVLDAASGTVGDIATCTADFRDQYYGLASAVREADRCPTGVPLVTTGLVEPASCLWGRRPTRFLKQRWRAPVVAVDALPPELASWAAARLVPKVLVATQGPVVEAVVDHDGRWLPSVPTVTVGAPAADLWHLLAVLLAPPVAAHAASRYAGTALTMRAVKLSARQVAALPLPRDRTAWDEGARLARRAQEHPDGPDRERLRGLGEVMTAAYRLPAQQATEVLDWWLGRLR